MIARVVARVWVVLWVLWPWVAMAGAPGVTTLPAEVRTATSAALNGSGTPEGEATSAWFRLSTTPFTTCDDAQGARVPVSGFVNLGSGTGEVPFTSTATGLLRGTSYWFCAVARNTSGTAFGDVLTFTVPATQPAHTTPTVTQITGTSALLSGGVIPNGASTTAVFRYAPKGADTGGCSATFGNAVPSPNGIEVGAGHSVVPITTLLTGLEPGTDYKVCSAAENEAGWSSSGLLTFGTLGAPTVSVSGGPGSLTTARMWGSSETHGADTIGWVRHSTTHPGICTDDFGIRTPESGGVFVAPGQFSDLFVVDIELPTPDADYFVCAFVENSEGTGASLVHTFRSHDLPEVITLPPWQVTPDSIGLASSVNPMGATTTSWFRFSTTDPGVCNDTFGTRIDGKAWFGDGHNPIENSALTYAVNRNTAYFACAIASNAYGTSYGEVVRIETLASAPEVYSEEARLVTSTSAQLVAAGKANGSATTMWFRYWEAPTGTCIDTAGVRVPASGGLPMGSGTTYTTITYDLSGLSPQTPYAFCAFAENAEGKVKSYLSSFTTAGPPEVVTHTPDNATPTAVTLHGSVLAGGLESIAWFRYSTTHPGACTDAFGTRAPATGGVDVGSSATQAVDYAVPASGLAERTTYYGCAIASNDAGMAFGSPVAFTTPGVPQITTLPPVDLPLLGTSLHARVTPGGSGAVVWFRYADTAPTACDDTFGTRVPAVGGIAAQPTSASTVIQQDLPGLLPGVDYHVCAIASNDVGTGFGAVQVFRKDGQRPDVVTEVTQAIATTSASLGATVRPNGLTTSVVFRYGTVEPEGCDDTLVHEAPAPATIDGASGSSLVSVPISGLLPSTPYYACAIAENGAGRVAGSVVSFRTKGPPSLTTLPPSTLTTTTARLEGAATANGLATVAWFRVSSTHPGACDDSFGTRVPATGGTSMGANAKSFAYSRNFTGAAPDTTYYVCAIGSNSEGTSYGEVLSFRTPSKPTVLTRSVSVIDDPQWPSAVMEATVNPNGAATLGWFRVDTTDPGACNATFGHRVPSTGGIDLGTGTTDRALIAWDAPVWPGHTYYVCALAENMGGITMGNVVTVDAPPARPTVTTQGTTDVAFTRAILQGSGTPQGSSTTAWFRYTTATTGTCNDSFGTRVPAVGGIPLGVGTSAVDFEVPLTGLPPGTTYRWCAIAESSAGKTYGAIKSFQTAQLPSAPFTQAATNVGHDHATLNASKYLETFGFTGFFRYGPINGPCDETYGTRVPSEGLPLAYEPYGGEVTFSETITGLQANTLYGYCAEIHYGDVTVFGTLQGFRTADVPKVTTLTSLGVEPTRATLSGSANPMGALATGWFRYDTADPGTCNDTFGTRAPISSGVRLGGAWNDVPFTVDLVDLTPNTSYAYCALASNVAGTGVGSVAWFTTPPAPPPARVETGPASAVGATTFTLHGSADPAGTPAIGYFRYGTQPGPCDETFGARAPSAGGTQLGAQQDVSVDFSASVTGLQPNTAYWACAVAENLGGTTFGNVQAVRTADAPRVTTLSVSNLLSHSATLAGSGNPMGALASGWFRYDTTRPGACDTTFGTQAPAGPSVALGSGGSEVPFAVDLIDLTPGTTYAYCALASNDFGTALGELASFTTPPETPSVTTVGATGIDMTSATLQATAIPGGGDAIGWFRFSSTHPGGCDDRFGTRVPTTGGTALGDGNEPASFQEALTGLAQGTTYYACAIAENPSGQGFGSIATFRTPGPPVVVTLDADNVGAREATLVATGNPIGTSSTGWFRYGTVVPTTCDDSYGERAPSTGSIALGNGLDPIVYTQATAALVPGTTYYACAAAQNAWGTTFGGFRSFTAQSVQPEVTTLSATFTDAYAAETTGSVLPNGAATTAWVRFSDVDPGTCTDTFGQRAPASGGTPIGAGLQAVPVTQSIDGLHVGTTYHYCVIASNSKGTTYGALRTYVHEASPGVRADGVTNLSGTSATLLATATPNGTDSIGWFRYTSGSPNACDDSFGIRIPTTGGIQVGSGFQGVAFSADLIGLTPGTRYVMCALAENAVGQRVSELVAFVTPAAPTVTTGGIADLAAREATLTGRVTPGGAATTARFRYSTTHPGVCNDSFGTPVGERALGSGTSEVVFTHVLTGLTPGTTYHLCAIAENSEGMAFGAVVSFATPAFPVAVTEAATDVGGSVARLRGSATPNGTLTMGWFRYVLGEAALCDDSVGTATDPWPLGSGSDPMPFDESLSGLEPGVTYSYCAIAENSAGKAYGAVVSFTTPGTPIVTTLAATSVGRTGATLQGSANPRAGTATAWFRYATTDPGTCSDAFGTRWPAPDGVALGAGTSPVPFNTPAPTLALNTTYWFCAMASNEAGVGVGEVLSFTTLTGPPVITRPVADLTAVGATLHGRATPQGTDTTGWFLLSSGNPTPCDARTSTRWPASGGAALGAGPIAVDFAQAVSGLAPGTTYQACAVAEDATGVGYGDVLSFSTPRLPDVSTLAPSDLTAGSARLRGEATPNGELTEGWFRYATSDPGVCSDAFGTATDPWPLGSGSTSMPFDNTLNSLEPATTYFYCALARNSGGTRVGEVLSFVTDTLVGVAPPSVSTLAPSDVSVSGATLHAAANPLGGATTGWFRYASAPPAACDDQFGLRGPSIGGVMLGDGTSAVAFSHTLSGLPSNTTFWACALAENAEGLSTGSLVSFRTETVASVPAVTTLAAMATSSTTARMEGLATTYGGSTTGWFRYDINHPGACDDTFGMRWPAAGGTFLGSDPAPVAYAEAITDLSPGTAYFVCAVASNAAGTAWGDVVSFTMPLAPDVFTLPPTGVGSDRATLEATVYANHADTSAWFRYATTDPGDCNDGFGVRAPGTGAVAVGNTDAPVALSRSIVGLTPGSTYYLCAIAENLAGTSLGEVVSFTTEPEAPLVDTHPPTDVDLTTATLHGTGTPNGAPTTAWFRYDTTHPGACDDNFGQREPASGGLDLGSGSEGVPFSTPIADLLEATPYFACAIAQNTEGTAYGPVVSFTLGVAAPEVVTEAPEEVTSTQATLVGSASPRGSEASGWFRIGPTEPQTCDDGFGRRVPSTGSIALGAGRAPVSYDAGATGLDPAQIYYACAAASNAGGASFGAPVSFTTEAAKPVVTTRPAEVDPDRSVTLLGGANPLGAAAEGWFRVSQEDPGGCDDAFGVRVPDVGATPLGAGRIDAAFEQTLADLAPGTWFVCAVAANQAGTGVGEMVTFVVPERIDEGSDPSCGCSVRTGGASPSLLWPLAGLVLAIGRRRGARAA